MAEQLPKSIIKELGGILTKGDYFYRMLVMEDGKQGEHWSKDKAVIEAHQGLFENKTEVEYTWQKGAEGLADKLRVYVPKAKDPKDTGKRPSAYAKEAGAKDDYWKGKDLHDRAKWEWEQARFTRNDKKIELQHYQNLLAPIALELFKTSDITADAAVDWLDSKATEIFNRHNPTTPAADVTKK